MLRVNIDKDLDTMHSDMTKIRQNVINLLSNASKFTEKGRIALDVCIEEGNANDARTMVAFKVKDTGIGMSETQMAKVFGSFTQADNSTTKKYGGTGLGLTITKQFTELMGGSITVESEVGIGTTFTMRIPKVTIMEEEKADTTNAA